jgi:hypothetical protein
MGSATASFVSPQIIRALSSRQVGLSRFAIPTTTGFSDLCRLGEDQLLVNSSVRKSHGQIQCQENIKHLTELLGDKLDPTKREMVVRFLSIEKAKLTAILELEEIRSKRNDCPRPIAAWLIALASGGAIRRAFSGRPSANF